MLTELKKKMEKASIKVYIELLTSIWQIFKILRLSKDQLSLIEMIKIVTFLLEAFFKSMMESIIIWILSWFLIKNICLFQCFIIYWTKKYECSFWQWTSILVLMQNHISNLIKISRPNWPYWITNLFFPFFKSFLIK
jgi:hypothetical protein